MRTGMLSSPVYREAHSRRIAAFASQPDVWALGGNRRKFPVPEMNLRDSVPAPTGYSVCEVVTPTTPTDPTGTLYPFSFQSLAEPCSLLYSNGTPFISFNFILLQTLSLTTDGYTPLPTKKSSLSCLPRSARGAQPRGTQFSALYSHFKTQPAPSISGRFDPVAAALLSSGITSHGTRVTAPQCRK
jgi:hypothetical protein